MAGDWIPYLKDLPEKLEVLALSRRTGRSVAEVVLALLRLWSWADAQTIDGHLPRDVDVTLLSRCIRDTDETFFTELACVGWLVETEAGLFLPNFDYWMGRSAKSRLQAAKRQRRNRTKSPPVTKPSRAKRDKSVTTGQNRTEENTPTPFSPFPTLDNDTFRAAWARWMTFRAEIKKPLTPTSEAAALKKLAKYTTSVAVKAVEESIANGWRGLFPDRIAETEPTDPQPAHPVPPVPKLKPFGRSLFDAAAKAPGVNADERGGPETTKPPTTETRGEI